MSDSGTVNSQVLDSVSTVATLIAGQAPSHAVAMLDTVMAETIGMAMYNAVNRQQNAGMVSSAAVVSACARMLNAFPPVPPADPPPPSAARAIDPIVGPTPPAPQPDPVRGALREGADAITQLRELADAARATAAGIDEQLTALAHEATAPAWPLPQTPSACDERAVPRADTQ